MIKKVFLLYGFVLIFPFCGCDDSSELPDFTKELDILSFTVNTPDDWDWVQDQGIDTFIGRINNETETIYFDMGYLSFGGLEFVKRDERTISFQNLEIDGIPSIIVEERTQEEETAGNIRFSVYIDAGDGQRLNRLYIFDPKDKKLIFKIFKTHKFK